MIDVLREFDGFKSIVDCARKFNPPIVTFRPKIYELTIGLVLPRRRINVTSSMLSVFDTKWSPQSISDWNSRTGSRTFRLVGDDKGGDLSHRFKYRSLELLITLLREITY